MCQGSALTARKGPTGFISNQNLKLAKRSLPEQRLFLLEFQSNLFVCLTFHFLNKDRLLCQVEFSTDWSVVYKTG